MNKDVLVTIKGLQYTPTDADDARIETISRGSYAFRNGKHFVSYEELVEGTSHTTKNIIKISENLIDVNKKGIYSVHLIFEKGKKNLTNYNTPFGQLIIGIDTSDIKLEVTDSCIRARIKYNMDMNYEHLASCEIDMEIKNAGSAL